ncbi:MAG: hypothetical protein IKA94_07430 [Mogibacterium sp.]|nr:hypothetical protein [Mogibacterium sp.]
MTEDEVTKVLGDLHMLHLANEPKNIDDLIYSWLAFFREDDARVIAKACYIYTKIKKKRFWPTPGDIEDLKQRAQWLIEMEDEMKQQLAILEEKQKKLNALGGARTHTNLINKQSTNHKTQPPRAPAIQIEEKRCELHSGSCVMMFSDMCDGPQDGKCLYEGL